MKESGVESYLPQEIHSSIIITFKCPTEEFSFKDYYEFFKAKGPLYTQSNYQMKTYLE